MLLIFKLFKGIYGKFLGFFYKFKKFPGAVLSLALVSGLMNLSTAIIGSTALDFFSSIGDTSFLIGIRSFSEGAGYIIKVLIGVMSDIAKQRRLFLLVGYGCVLFIKPLFVLVSFNFFTNYIKSIIYCIAQSSDRILNAARDPARDSLIADWTNKEDRLSAFSFRKFCSSLGSIFGGILVIICLKYTSKYSIIYTIAAIPAFLSVFILYIYVKDNKNDKITEKESWFSIKDLLLDKQSLKYYGIFMLTIFLLNFGKLNEVCLWKISTDIGYSHLNGYLYILYYTIIAFSSYCIACFNVRNNLEIIIFCNLSLFFGNLIISYSNSIFTLLLGIVLYGIYNGIIENIISGMIITIFPKKNMRATLFGIMNTILGMSIFSSFLCVRYLLKSMHLKNIYFISTIPTIGSFIILLFLNKYFK
ncbi:hypothetical protein AB836_00870 [Rickettsiales bacterium (ex Bugula neritina AB1)]|nr:hypothetical protein AB836_00870 [Rickettsiales bacterium (ex Bugula neritina AB1)]